METGSLKLIESCPVLNQELHALWDQADCCPMLSWTAQCVSRERGKGREGKGREGKGREGKGREGKKPAHGCRGDEARQHVCVATTKSGMLHDM